jgi:hypothetical protein
VFRVILAVAVLAIATAVPHASPVVADTGLTGSIAAAYFLRYEDADLHAIAHERATEIAECECLSHDLMRSGTAEVIAYNEGFPDPVARVVSGWRASPGHHGILSNRDYGRIGCAEVVADGVHWFACVLTFGELPPAPAPVQLPDTALPPEG